MQGASYFDIRNHLTKQKYTSPFGLSARLWKLALKEAYDLHYRTRSAQMKLVKQNLLEKIFVSNLDKTTKDVYCHLTNRVCYNLSTFLALEKALFPYKFSSQHGKQAIAFIENFKHFKGTIFQKELDETWLKPYVYRLIKLIRRFQQNIVSQINPTIVLDSSCYKLYAADGNFLDVVSLTKSQRIKGIQLSGYQNSLPKRFASNICLSFEATGEFYLHFSFRNKETKSPKNGGSLGGDFGSTEMLTLSDKKVVGSGQGKLLKVLTEKNKVALKEIQARSKPNHFGIEPENTKRRKRIHAFNHNIWSSNIELDYRRLQQKQNRRLHQHLTSCVNELKKYCQEKGVSTLVVEELNYQQLGRNKSQKRVFNLIKGFYKRVESQKFVNV